MTTEEVLLICVKIKRCNCEHDKPSPNHSNIPRLSITQLARELAQPFGEEFNLVTDTIRYSYASQLLRIFKILYAASTWLPMAIIAIHVLERYKHHHFTHLCKPYNRDSRCVCAPSTHLSDENVSLLNSVKFNQQIGKVCSTIMIQQNDGFSQLSAPTKYTPTYVELNLYRTNNYINSRERDRWRTVLNRVKTPIDEYQQVKLMHIINQTLDDIGKNLKRNEKWTKTSKDSC